MGRKPCCEKEGLNRGAWTAQEDKILSDYIQACGEGKWNSLPRKAGLKRCGKSCRLRWLNYLRPDIKRGNITRDEEDLIVRLHKLLGNRWSLIAGRLPGRTDNEIKNYWNTNLSKKLELESTRKQPIITNSKQTQEKKTLMEVRDSAVHHSDKELAKSVPIKTTAFKCTKNFSLQEPHHQLISSRPAGTGPNQDQPSSWPSDEASKGYFADFEARFGFSELDAVAGGGDVDDLFFRSTGGVQEVKETEFADDFNFLNELLDSEGGWIGDL